MKILIALLLFCAPAQAEKFDREMYQAAIDGVYTKLNNTVPIDRAVFDDGVNKQLTKVNVWPEAIVIGVMGRCQNVVGVCLGAQANIGLKNGKLIASVYGLGGVSVGAAEMYKVEVYTALCWGDCLDTLAQGLFVGADIGFALGEGASGFIEVGTDITELFGWGRKFDWKDFWNYKTIYAGVAFNYGVGIGVAGDVYYYRHLWSKEIDVSDIATLDL